LQLGAYFRLLNNLDETNSPEPRYKENVGHYYKLKGLQRFVSSL